MPVSSSDPSWKTFIRVALHEWGGLGALRWKTRNTIRIPMFHTFSPADSDNLDAICAYMARHFEPISLSEITDALAEHRVLPANAITVTVDDAYKSFYEYGFPAFRKYRIPATVYAVSGFADGRLWAWWDQVLFALEHTPKSCVTAGVNGDTYNLPLGSAEERTAAFETLVEALKLVPNQKRIEFVASVGELCGVDIPRPAPAQFASMTWEDMRAAAADGAEIGCHTHTHPILSRISETSELKRETAGAKELMEERLGFPVRHFSYPNGRDIDVGNQVEQAVRDAGFVSATTTNWGLNARDAHCLKLRRLPFHCDTKVHYCAELLAGLHS